MFSTCNGSQGSSLRGLLLAAAACLVSAPAAASPPQQSPSVVVAAAAGDVRVTSGGAPVKAANGMTLLLPASIHTGTNGSIELRQGRTIVNVGANSQVDIPESGDPSETLDRIVQARGNVYYDVAKRPSRKLRVETPYLVAVIKGTRFNVSATDAVATVSLFEGVIELNAGNGADVFEISAGQIGSASAAQPRLRVLRMDTGDVIRASAPPAPVNAGGSAAVAAASSNAATAPASATAAVASNRSAASLGEAVPASARATAEVSMAPRIVVSNAVTSSPTAERGNSMLALESVATRTGSQGNANANGNSGSSAGGNGNGNSGSNAGGAGNGNSGSNAGGNSSGNSGSNAGGNGNSGSSAGGSGNANANANANANGALPGVVQVIQDLARGNGNAGSNSNAGNGNGNGNGNGQGGNGKP
jgi:hypothetical protein